MGLASFCKDCQDKLEQDITNYHLVHLDDSDESVPVAMGLVIDDQVFDVEPCQIFPFQASLFGVIVFLVQVVRIDARIRMNIVWKSHSQSALDD